MIPTFKEYCAKYWELKRKGIDEKNIYTLVDKCFDS